MSTADTCETRTGHPIARCAGRVRDALGAVATAPAWSMTADEQRATLVELTRARAQLAELRLRVLAAADLNQVGDHTGCSSTGAWLAHQTKQTRAHANAEVRTAQALDTAFETTRTALAEGRLSEEQARVIVAVVTDLPDDVSAEDRRRAEAHLVDAAAEHDATALRVLGRKLFELIAPDEAERREGEQLEREEAEARRKACLTIRDNGDGSYSGRFKLPTLHAQALQKVLQALTAPRRIGTEGRTDADGNKVPYPTLLGHGLMELIEHLPTQRLPKCAGTNVTLVVTIGLDQLLSGIGAASLDTGGKISAGEARRLACNAGIIPLVLGGESMPLDVGRARRLHTKYQRVALAHRDTGCTAENCDRPPGWCEAHHEIPWSQGGQTTTDNGRLLCSWHHHIAHHPGYHTRRLPNGQVRFRRRQ